MTSGVTVVGELPDSIRMLGRVDAEVSAAVTKVRREALDAYRQAAPGRIKGGVKVRRSSATGQKLTITIGKVPMGGAQSGRDVGTQAVAYFTNFGTKSPITRSIGIGNHRTGRVRGRRRTAAGPPPPFRLANGAFVTEVRGQRAQNWIAEARRQADANAQVLIDQHLERDITDLLERM